MSKPRIMQKDLMEADDVDFEEVEERWNIYKLDDGTTLKVRLVLRRVKRLKKWNPDGSPIYVINSNDVVRVANVPKELKAKPEPSAFETV